MPDRDDFQTQLARVFEVASDLGLSFIDLKAGDLHRMVGGYPGQDHRMPICCNVMYDSVQDKDRILDKPRKGKGANLIIRFQLPR